MLLCHVQVLNVWLAGDCHEFRTAVPRKWARAGAAAAAAGNVVTPMPGKVIKVCPRASERLQACKARWHVQRVTSMQAALLVRNLCFGIWLHYNRCIK